MAKQRVHPPPAGIKRPAAAEPDDASLFRAAVNDVKPLPHAPRVEGLGKPHVRRGAHERAAADALKDAKDMLGDVISTPDSPTGADPLSFSRPGVRAQTLRRLRRGLFPVEDELDLHGMSRAAARDGLAEFLVFSRNAGRRCVRIIHGKGYRSGARGPILKIAVDSWLRRHSDVMAFTSARAIDGGTGAVYVLLRA